MAYVVSQPPIPTVAVAGTDDRFPVRRIYCVGRNYAAHAREMGHDPDREPPFFFQKPADALLPEGAFPYPPLSGDVHHEIELVVALARGGRDIAAGSALDHVFGYAVGLDMTRRDLQRDAKKAGRPWAAAKGFDCSAPCSKIHRADRVPRTPGASQPPGPVDRIGHPDKGAIWLRVNGEDRQRADLADMIWGVPDIIAHLSRLFELRPGDLIYSGTPAGVGPVERGDVMHGGIDGLGEIKITVA